MRGRTTLEATDRQRPRGGAAGIHCVQATRTKHDHWVGMVGGDARGRQTTGESESERATGTATPASVPNGENPTERVSGLPYEAIWGKYHPINLVSICEH